MNKRCFVISPIGDENSDIRKNSDDLLDLIIIPALEVYNFEIIRGDKIPSPSVITDDIISLVQNADLCIIDLTNKNPNVFYECGRRHETAKPYLHIKRKGETLPFDLAGIRTIDYDISSGRSIRESINQIRKYVSELELAGYNSNSTGVTLNSLASTMARLERKIDTLNKPETYTSEKQKIVNISQGNPIYIFNEAINNGDFDLAVLAVIKFNNITPNKALVLNMTGMLMENFDPRGVSLTKEIIQKYFDDLTPSSIASVLFTMYQFYNSALSLEDNKNYFYEISKKIIDDDKQPKDEKAQFYNVLSSVEYSLKNYDLSIKHQLISIEYDPQTSAYYNNIIGTYKAIGNTLKMVEWIRQYLKVHKELSIPIKSYQVKNLLRFKEHLKGLDTDIDIQEIDDLIAKEVPDNK